MRKTIYFAVPVVLLVVFFAFLRALDPRSEGRPPAEQVVAPPPPTSTDLLKLVDLASTGDVYLGQNGGGGEFFKGELRDVAVWARALGEAEATGDGLPVGAEGFWPLDGRSPEVVTDASPNGNHGTSAGGVRWTGEGSEKALSFDGSTGFVRIPRSKGLEGAAVSLSCRIRRTGDEGQWTNVVRKTWFNNLSPTFLSWSLQLNPDGKSPDALVFHTGFAGGCHGVIAKGAVPEGRWVRVTAVYDPTSSAPQKKLYVDGSLVASAEERHPIVYDSLQNQWRFEGKDLVSPLNAGAASRLVLPGSLPEEYDLTIVARRLRGLEGLHVGLRCGNSGCAVVLDGVEKGEYRSGLDLVDGKGYRENSTTATGRLIVNDQPFTVTCAVRRKKITVSLDGTPVLRWNGDPAKLSTDPFFRFPKPDALYVGSWESSYRITKLTLSAILPDAPGRP
jgi:hypothetical protein